MNRFLSQLVKELLQVRVAFLYECLWFGFGPYTTNTIQIIFLQYINQLLYNPKVQSIQEIFPSV